MNAFMLLPYDRIARGLVVQRHVLFSTRAVRVQRKLFGLKTELSCSLCI